MPVLRRISNRAQARFLEELKRTKRLDRKTADEVVDNAYEEACDSYDKGDFPQAAYLSDLLIKNHLKDLNIFQEHGCWTMIAKVQPEMKPKAEHLHSYVMEDFGDVSPLVVEIMECSFFRCTAGETLDRFNKIKEWQTEDELSCAMKRVKIAELEEAEGNVLSKVAKGSHEDAEE